MRLNSFNTWQYLAYLRLYLHMLHARLVEYVCDCIWNWKPFLIVTRHISFKSSVRKNYPFVNLMWYCNNCYWNNDSNLVLLRITNQSFGPENSFEEQIKWTEEGKQWPYPIDNEYMFGPETEVCFFPACKYFCAVTCKEFTVLATKESPLEHFPVSSWLSNASTHSQMVEGIRISILALSCRIIFF